MKSIVILVLVLVLEGVRLTALAVGGQVVSYHGFPASYELCAAHFIPDTPRQERVTNVTLSITGTWLTLSWSSVPNAQSYKVYSANAPEGPYSVETGGVFVGTTWSRNVLHPKRFFYVTSVSEVPDGFIIVEGGSFFNGTSNVSISTFFLSSCELIQSFYQSVMGTNPSWFSGIVRPVETVSWFDAIAYCNRRSLQEGLTPCYRYLNFGYDPDHWPAGWNASDDNDTNVFCDWHAKGYRLPTEMEWMFAAQGGILSQGYTYSGGNTLSEVGWYNANSGATTHGVAGKDPNELGCYDMSGNVYELVWDLYGAYPAGDQTDPTGPGSGTLRLIRGGCWASSSSQCTPSFRVGIYPTWSDNDIGFRICRSPERFVFVDGGSFHNGVSTVHVSDFYLDPYEVTQTSYEAVMGQNPSSGYGIGWNYPVYYVDWFHAVEYCNRRSILESRTPCYSYGGYGTDPDDWPTGWNTVSTNHSNIICNWVSNGYRLPTEMEWMYAAKGGNLTPTTGYNEYSGTDSEAQLINYAWYVANNIPEGPKPVGTKLPNELGLFDMSGNTWEWCWDIYGDYPSGTQYDPHGATTGTTRVVRGGAFGNAATYCRVRARSFGLAYGAGAGSGFRVCRNSE